MVRTTRLLLLILTMALTLAGVGAVQAGSAEPRPNDTTLPRTSGAVATSPRGEFGATAIVGVSKPSAAWTADGFSLDIVQSFQGELAYKFWTVDAGWSDWFTLGAPAAGLDAAAPAITWATNLSRLDVFAKGGSDGHLYQKTLTSTGWSEWMDLGGVLVEGPSATSTFGGRIDVFGVGTDFRLYQKSWLGSSWTDWVGFAAPGAGIGSAPSATWANSTRIDVFVTGDQDGVPYQKSWLSSIGWTNWVKLDGVLVSPPAASWTNNGRRIDVFGVGTDSRLYQKSWLSSSGWTGWVAFEPPAGGIDELGPGISWVANGTRLDVVVTRTTDGNVFQLAWTPSGWSEWVDLL